MPRPHPSLRTALTTACVFASLLLLALLSQNYWRSATPTYNVSVKNESTTYLRNVTVAYDDGSWSFTFGILAPGKSKSHNETKGMPPLPKTAKVTWRTQSGTQKSAVATIPANALQSQSNDLSELEIAIADDKAEARLKD